MKSIFRIVAILFLLVSGGYFIIATQKISLLQDVDFSTAVFDNNHKLLRLTTSSDEKYRLFTPLNQIPKSLVQALLLKEDRYFYYHHGINPWSLIRAVTNTYIFHHHRVGASTITMQVARLRFHIDSHHVLGKIKQIIYAIRIDHQYSKEKILEAYLNLAPYGHNIEGVGAASLIYFSKPIAQLPLPQLLTLSVIPQNPALSSAKNATKLYQSRFQLFQQWIKRYPQDKNYIALIKLPVQLGTIKQLPFQAPHWVDFILKWHPRASIINTTLDLRLQQGLEQAFKKYLQENANRKINNAAALLVDTRNMSVKAWLGSGNFYDAKIEGQNNGVLAPRSPGSALKPFIYALALDQGLIHPATVLKDMPLHFGSYDPENFDYRFLGPLRAKDALVLSRNIPAIDLANKLRNPTLYQFLKMTRMPLQDEKKYGLGLVLGDAEISMLQLTRLYAMLANQGIYKSFKYWEEQPTTPHVAMLSAEASFLTLDMLKDNARPHQIFTNNREEAKIPWKTGTSSSFRDAWSIGIVGPYVLAVWVGNFNSVGNPSFTGQKAAAPLFFALQDTLEKQNLLSSTPDIKNLNITRIKVCAATGLLPTYACPGTYETWFIPGKSPIEKDKVFREVMIDAETGLRTCHFDPKNKFEIYEFWPSNVLQLFRQAGIARRTPPAFDNSCPSKFSTHPNLQPSIASPRSSFTYTVTTKTKNTYTIPLQAIVDANVTNLFWFANNKFLGKTTSNAPFLWHPNSGNFVIRVVDNFGNSDAVNVVVTQINDDKA